MAGPTAANLFILPPAFILLSLVPAVPWDNSITRALTALVPPQEGHLGLSSDKGSWHRMALDLPKLLVRQEELAGLSWHMTQQPLMSERGVSQPLGV